MKTKKHREVTLFDLFKKQAVKGFNYPTIKMCSDGDVCTFLKSVKLQ